MFAEFGINAGYVEDLLARYLQNPQSVPDGWRAFFDSQGYGNGYANGSAAYAAPGSAAYAAPGSAAYAAPAAAPPIPGPPASAPAPSVPGGSTHGAAASGTNGASVAPARLPTAPPLPNIPPVSAPTKTNGSHFQGVPYLASGAPPAPLAVDPFFTAVEAQGRVFQLVNAYRVRGHLFAHVDPLGQAPGVKPELELGNFGFTEEDMDRVFPTVGLAGLPDRATLREIVAHLSQTYCGAIGVEFTHIEDPDRRNWLQEAMESTGNRASFDKAEMLRILTKLTDAELFEQFIHRNYVGAKRFSLEGAEAMIPMLDLLIEAAGEHGVDEMVIGMAHRGRLNVLVNILGKDPRDLFAKFFDNNPERFLGSGDVKYHLGYSNDRVTEGGQKVHLSLAFNPSHLEWVNPVVEGRTRAKQDRKKRRDVMPMLIHGDAAFMGQGVVPETLNLASLAGYTTGGTIHLVVNNQVGFTTNPEDSRSTRYCTDIARMMRVPVFHVNGEDPEAVIQVARLATEFRQQFAMDVVIDMYCYRKYGHNEGDEPRFTQPVMYSLIDKKPSVRQMYVQRLVRLGVVTEEKAQNIVEERKRILDAALEEAKKGDFNALPNAFQGVWAGFKGGPDASAPEVKTSVERGVLMDLADRLAMLPEGFQANPKVLKGTILARRDAILNDKPFDWGTAEHLAYATLLAEGTHVRLTGQDVRRGTFTHRHAVLFDAATGKPYCPLAHVGKAAFDIYDSPLSEAGVLGFEYGYSLDSPDGLVLWEAQFGDFANTAQVIIDQFVTSAEDKWMRLSGLVMLLPHGYEGQGPEHSSARIERFLQLCAEDNVQLCNLTTPAQFFHVLRRQVLRPLRKPLIVFTPKSLLRHPAAVSTVDDLVNGSFQRVIGDTTVDPKKTKTVLLCSGKVYYELAQARKERGREDVAIIRLEQLYPVSDGVKRALSAFKKGTPVVWVQDEPRNMGAWYFLNARKDEIVGADYPLSVASRAESASPATGSKASHDLEQKMLIDEAFSR